MMYYRAWDEKSSEKSSLFLCFRFVCAWTQELCLAHFYILDREIIPLENS